MAVAISTSSPHPSPHLPDELLLMILSQVDGRSLAQARQVSRQWSRCASTEALWRAAVEGLPKAKEQLPAMLPRLAPPSVGTWQDVYKLEVTLARADERMRFWRNQASNAWHSTSYHPCVKRFTKGLDTSMDGLLTMVRAVTLGPLAAGCGVIIGTLGAAVGGAGFGLGLGLIGAGLGVGFAVAEVGGEVAWDSLVFFAYTAILACQVAYAGVEIAARGPLGVLQQVGALGHMGTALIHLPSFLRQGVALCHDGHRARAALQAYNALRAHHSATWQSIGEANPGANNVP